MEESDFDQLLQSVREGGRILRGEATPSREFSISGEEVGKRQEPEDPDRKS